MSQKFKLRGTFKDYVQVDCMSKLDPCAVWYDQCKENGVEADFNEYYNEERLKNFEADYKQIYIDDDYYDGYYIEVKIPEKEYCIGSGKSTDFIDGKRNFYIHGESLWGEGASLEEAENDLEKKYKKYLKIKYSTNENFGVFPELDYVEVTVKNQLFGSDGMMEKIRQSTFGEENIKSDNIFGGDEFVLWGLDDKIKSNYQIKDQEQFDNISNFELKEQFELNQYGVDEFGVVEYCRELNYTQTMGLFRVGYVIYHISLCRIFPGLIIHEIPLNEYTIPDIRDNAYPILKKDLLNKWESELKYLEFEKSLTRKQLSKVLDFVEDYEEYSSFDLDQLK